jgi:hypothetical protein
MAQGCDREEQGDAEEEEGDRGEAQERAEEVETEMTRSAALSFSTVRISSRAHACLPTTPLVEGPSSILSESAPTQSGASASLRACAQVQGR